MAELMPVFLKLEGKPVLLVGGGGIALEKLARLLAAGAHVRIVAREISGDVARYIAQSGDQVTVETRDVEEADVHGVTLVINATGDSTVNDTLARASRRFRVWSNAADDAGHCDFYLAGTVTRGPVTLAVSSSGRFPGLTRALRTVLDELIPEDHVLDLESLTNLRARLRNSLPETSTRIKALKRLGSLIREEYFGQGYGSKPTRAVQ